MKALRNALSCGWKSYTGRLNLLRQHTVFALPSPHLQWPDGTGFATGSIDVGELLLAEVTTFEEVWSTLEGGPNRKGIVCFRPVNIPPGYHCLGYYCQANTGTIDGSILVAKVKEDLQNATCPEKLTPLASPTDFQMVWSSREWRGQCTGTAYFWLPCPPEGYRPLGYIITCSPLKPDVNDVKCVREDLTDGCKKLDGIWTDKNRKTPFFVWNVYPCATGMNEKAISVGTFHCGSSLSGDTDVPIACLKNTYSSMCCAMPSADQIHALITTYGPVIYFHPKETYFPSSLSWFFEQGALLYTKGSDEPQPIASDGSNLPVGGENDGQHWIDLPHGEHAEEVKKGNLASAKGYVQVKPMLGGTATDLVVWIFYPFNGASTAKLGLVDVPMGKIGEHVCDWEHITLRISNFNGHLKKVYFAQHSGGYWVNASELEYAYGNHPAVYASKYGHASYPSPGLVLQGDARVGIGLRNDTAESGSMLDTSKNYEVISAEYLHALNFTDPPKEPVWLHYAREWGPKIQYDSRTELDRVLQKLPHRLRSSLQTLVRKFPNELSGQEGPTGPRQKNYWIGDERVRHH